MEFPFYDSPDTATIICCHILKRQAPILYVSHDEDNGMWQFLCGGTHETDEAKKDMPSGIGIVLLLIGILLAVVLTNEIKLIHPIVGYICIGYWIDLILLVVCAAVSSKKH